MMAVSNTFDKTPDCELSQAHSRTTKVSNKERLQQPRSKLPPTCSQENFGRPHYARPTANSSARKHVLKPRLSTDSSSSSSRSRPRFRYSPTIPRQCPDAATTDPEHITQLWKTVMAHLGGTKHEDEADQDPITHFGVPEMPRDSKLRLEVYRKSFGLSVWLEPNIEDIQREYKAMRAYSCNEAEYQTFALRSIFLDEPRYPDLPEDGGDKRWLPIRMVQLVRKLPQSKWLPPPPVPGSNLPKRYEWDIRPDCTYHVSLQAFQPGFRSKVRKHVSIIQQRAFCPYLTIEFKKDEENLDTARHQVAISSAISLYNRYLLKTATLQACGTSWSEDDQSQMRHYGITLTGSNWNLWCTVPKTFVTWTGCTMSSIYSADCRTVAGIQQLIEFLNDIHYWGLEVHGKSCKRDIHAKTRSDPSADTRDVSLLS
ncbi:hypothetical protein GQX73_g5724 [Xylaria multiplex]|uniref:Uncharacterized protein n=1 Tax=Xylaria multiplex TaxID=323545 RepID=A0A7C8N6L9_9PEZI|nr:hypothetical protein GQX73_g5724 [Xylaria multiplex]